MVAHVQEAGAALMLLILVTVVPGCGQQPAAASQDSSGIATTSRRDSGDSEVLRMDGWSNQGSEMTFADVLARFPIARKLIYNHTAPDDVVRVVEGDLTVDGPLVCDWNEGHGADGLFVTGSLTVRGPIINRTLEGGPFLFVGGKTHAKAILKGGAEFLFVGDAVVDDIVIGEYNDGVLRFGGNLTVPVAIADDHHFEVASFEAGSGLHGRWIDTFNTPHPWTSVLHPGIHVETDEDGNEHLNVMRELESRLRKGISVLRPDLPPVEEFPHPYKPSSFK